MHVTRIVPKTASEIKLVLENADRPRSEAMLLLTYPVVQHHRHLHYKAPCNAALKMLSE